MLGRFSADGASFSPARAATSTYSLAHPYRTGAAPPPRAAGRGYCAPTQDGSAGDCMEGHKGMWRMEPGLPIADKRGCVAHCYAVCPRCRFVSVSAHHKDCSWFSECDVTRLHLEWSGDTYQTLAVV